MTPPTPVNSQGQGVPYVHDDNNHISRPAEPEELISSTPGVTVVVPEEGQEVAERPEPSVSRDPVALPRMKPSFGEPRLSVWRPLRERPESVLYQRQEVRDDNGNGKLDPSDTVEYGATGVLFGNEGNPVMLFVEVGAELPSPEKPLVKGLDFFVGFQWSSWGSQ